MHTCSMLGKGGLYYSHLSTMTWGGKTQEATIIHNLMDFIQTTNVFFFYLFDYIIQFKVIQTYAVINDSRKT